MQKKIYTLPNLTPRLSICPNGCLHLDIGPARLNISAEGLREFREAATQILDAIPPSAPPIVADKDLH